MQKQVSFSRKLQNWAVGILPIGGIRGNDDNWRLNVSEGEVFVLKRIQGVLCG